MKRTRPHRRLRGVVLAALTLVGLLALAGVGSARSQAAPANATEPQISGSAVVGSTLKSTKGTWAGSPTSYDFQWTRCPASGGVADASNCAVISGATTTSYVPGGGDVGKTLRTRVTATNADGSATVASNPTGVVKAATGLPRNTSEPQVKGSAVVGSTLTGTTGTWTGSPTSYHLRWTRCAASGSASNASDCTAIGDATTTSYVPAATDVGSRLRLRVTATNDAGSKTVASNATGVVRAATQPPPPVSNGCAKTGGTIPVGGVSPPARLAIDQTQISPAGINYGTRSVTARVHVSACSGSVEGALVYVTVVPYGQFGGVNEVPTGSDGWASVQLTALRGFPVSQKQQLLVMFVRARKSGENLTGGISTRRLVSFHVARGQ